MSTDPVCGMEVDESTPLCAERDGQTYYFCSNHCRRRFLAEGRADVPRQEKPVSRHDVAPYPGAIYTCPMHPDVISERPGECPECGMFLEKVAGGMVLAVPRSAVLDSGPRKLVYLDLGDGRYQPQEVMVGPQAEAELEGNTEKFFPILSGLAPGDRVVTRANFLIDSQSQLTGEAAGAYGGALEADAQPPQHVH